MTDIPFNDHASVDEKLVAEVIEKINTSPASKQELETILCLIDLTTLEGKDNADSIKNITDKAKKYSTAAVCVYPTLVKKAKAELKNTNIKVASVAGAFPSGQLPLQLRLEEAKYSIDEGADEIDMVISRGEFLAGNYSYVYDEVSAFKQICKSTTLKVILETGELKTLENISKASDIALLAGADFIKTSTGKISENATLSAVCVMLDAIKKHHSMSGKLCGIKPSGGISDGNTAAKYLRLTSMILGNDCIKPTLFRFGASRLVDNIVAQLNGNAFTTDGGY